MCGDISIQLLCSHRPSPPVEGVQQHRQQQHKQPQRQAGQHTQEQGLHHRQPNQRPNHRNILEAVQLS
jgi:hypothetical protein